MSRQGRHDSKFHSRFGAGLIGQRGLSLTEVMIAVAITGIIAAGATVFLQRQMFAKRIMEHKSAMEMLSRRITNVAQDPASLLGSAGVSYAGNRKLRDCLDKDSASPCNVTNSNNRTQFRLFQNAATLQAVAGTNGVSVVAYNRYGHSGPANVKHPIRSHAEFFAMCPPDTSQTALPSSCPRAEVLCIRTRVEYVDAAGTGMQLTSIPPESSFNADGTNHCNMVSVDEIIKSYSTTQDVACNDPAALMVGRDSDGNPTCRCPASFTETPGASPGQVNCNWNGGTWDCPADFMPVGVKLDGTVACRPVGDNEACFDGPCDAADNCVCGDGAWLKSIHLAVCKMETTSDAKKGSSTHIACNGSSKGVCCTQKVTGW